jgi:hypothetical protein
VGSNTNRLILGFIVALILGGGGGFAVELLAAREKTPFETTPLPAKNISDRIVIESVRGSVRVLAPSGTWRPAREGDTLERPTGIKADGPEASITLFHAGVRVVAQRDARVMIGAAGTLGLVVDSGQLLVHSSAGKVKVQVPSSQASLVGDAFGVWARRESLTVAVLDNDVALQSATQATKYPSGREVVLTSGGAVPSVLAPQLKIEVQSIEKQGGRFAITAKANMPNAAVYVKRGARYEEVPVGQFGSFTVVLDRQDPVEGELVAYDAAGRRAQIDRPSEMLDRTLEALAKNATREAAGPVKRTAKPEDEASSAKSEPKSKAKQAIESLAETPPTSVPGAPVKGAKKKKFGAHGDHGGSTPKTLSFEDGTKEEGQEAAEPPTKAAPGPKAAPKESEPDNNKKDDGEIEVEWGK